MDALGHQRFAVYGTDTGMVIAYALAADHPDRVDRLVVSEAPLPGLTPSPPLYLPPQLNARLWHLAFNQLETVNEQLVTGREDIFFGAEFDASAGTSKLPAGAVRYYVDTIASEPDYLRGSFGIYRALPTTIAQNQERKSRRLTMPVLAIGGAESAGDVGREHDAAGRGRRADRGPARQRPLGRRAGSRRPARRPDHVPGPVPGRLGRRTDPRHRTSLTAARQPPLDPKENPMSVTTEKPAAATAIRPFRVEIPDEELADLRRRIAATRWPEPETVPDQSQGVQLAQTPGAIRLLGYGI